MPTPSPHEDPPQDPPSSAADDALIGRVQRTLLGQLAQAATTRHLTVPAGPADWQPFMDGIELKVLHAAEASLSYLLRLQPGAVLPGHRHPQDEECVVLEGELRIGDVLKVGAGSYHLARAGALHAPITTDTGALIFLRGAEPAPDDLI